MAVKTVHHIAAAGIESPHLIRLNKMEAACVVLFKLLHLCNIEETVVVIAEVFEPAGSAAIVHSFQNERRFLHTVRRLGEKVLQDRLVNGRENVGCKQSLNILFVKT